MSPLPHIQLGDGPDLVLLHGVGLGPATFARLADLLAVDHRVLVIDRDAATAGRPLEDQVVDLAETIADAGCDAPQVVGVSGGATLGLLLAIRHPGVVGSLVLHEPLVGRRAEELFGRFEGSAATAAQSDAGALEVVRSVMGERTWSALDELSRARVAAGAARARADVPVFAGFAPSDGELRGLRPVPLLTTVGETSGPERHAAAAVLVDLCGAISVTIPDAGNAVQLDAPDRFADVVRTWTPASAGAGR